MNYIKVFLNSKSEIKLKEKKDLINTVIDIYAVCINAAYNEMKTTEQPFIKKLIQNKCYQVAKAVAEKEKNYSIIKKQYTD